MPWRQWRVLRAHSLAPRHPWFWMWPVVAQLLTNHWTVWTCKTSKPLLLIKVALTTETLSISFWSVSFCNINFWLSACLFPVSVFVGTLSRGCPTHLPRYYIVYRHGKQGTAPAGRQGFTITGTQGQVRRVRSKASGTQQIAHICSHKYNS